MVLIAAIFASSIFAIPFVVTAKDDNITTKLPPAALAATTASTDIIGLTVEPSEAAKAEQSDTAESNSLDNNPANSSNVSLTVNNEVIPVPPNGSTSKTIVSDDGQTKVSVQVSNKSSNTTSRNSVRVHSSTHSSQTISTSSSQQVTNEGELEP